MSFLIQYVHDEKLTEAAYQQNTAVTRKGNGDVESAA
jgi:hypothetical protein